MSHTESDEYQKEIAKQYKQRVTSFTLPEVVTIMDAIGFSVLEEDLKLAECGNMNATFLTDKYVIKISNEKDPQYQGNSIISKQLRDVPVVNVLAYDYHDKTDYEVLVMSKSEGNLWQDTIPEQDEATIEAIFRQILEVVHKASTLQGKNFGSVASANEVSYESLLERDLTECTQLIKTKKLAAIQDVDRLEQYVRKHLHILKDETPVLVHGDLHMGNILHLGSQLTCVIDWDGASYLPKFLNLFSLLGLIDKPSQFVEGTPDYPRFKGVQFLFLLPILKSELDDVFTDKKLVHKLNVVGVVIGLMWVSQDWSKEWNEEMIKNLVENETPNDLANLNNTYYGKLLG